MVCYVPFRYGIYKHLFQAAFIANYPTIVNGFPFTFSPLIKKL